MSPDLKENVKTAMLNLEDALDHLRACQRELAEAREKLHRSTRLDQVLPRESSLLLDGDLAVPRRLLFPTKDA